MLQAYKYRLYPTKEQKILIAKTFGCCRYIYNRTLGIKMSLYEKEKRGISVFELTNQMVNWKREKETEWLKEVNSQALQMSLRNLDNAYTRFFREKKGFPKFKSKNGKQSFANPQSTILENGRLFIPKFKKGIKVVIDRKPKGKIKSSFVSQTPSGKYYVSILTEDENFVEPKTQTPDINRTLGIDLGIKTYLTDSNGNKIENPKFLNRKLKYLQRQQRKLSRKQKGSINREKQRIKVAVAHEKVTNARKDFLHKLTKKLVENQDYDSIAMENLNVTSMLQEGTKKLSQYIADASWGEFKRQIEYKSKWYGKNLLIIGQFEPSSKLCSCGYLNSTLMLTQREWKCPSCGQKHNRDILAAQNIKHFAFCKQNTYRIGQELSESTLVESEITRTMKQETAMVLTRGDS